MLFRSLPEPEQEEVTPNEVRHKPLREQVRSFSRSRVKSKKNLSEKNFKEKPVASQPQYSQSQPTTPKGVKRHISSIQKRHFPFKSSSTKSQSDDLSVDINTTSGENSSNDSNNNSNNNDSNDNNDNHNNQNNNNSNNDDLKPTKVSRIRR